jgi:hypothetical protein
MPYTKLVLHDAEEEDEEEGCFICVTIARNWL